MMATLEQIEQALRAADAAGNTEDARRLAQAYAQMRSSAPRADFSDVSANVDSTYRPAPSPANNSDFARLITGKRPAKANPSLFRLDSDFKRRSGVGPIDMTWAAAKDMFGSREGAAEYLAKQSGGVVGKDGDGSPTVRLPDGTAYRLNDEGFDSTDVANVAGNIAAFAAPAGLAARVGQVRNVGLLGRAGLQAAAAGGTDAALQSAFNQGEVDPVRTAAAAVGGAAGEVAGRVLGAGIRRGGELIRKFRGTNVKAAADFMQEQGLRPDPNTAKALAPQMEQIRAGADPKAILGEAQYGFRYSKGQRMTDPAEKFRQLSKEELLKQSPGGNIPFDSARRNNAEQLQNAINTLGDGFGARAAATPAEMVQGAASRLSGQADELGARISDAYARASEGGRTAIRSDAVATLPDRLRSAVQDFDVHPSITPATSRTLDQLRGSTDSILSFAKGGNVSGVTLKALETQRRVLNNNIKAAANPADRAAMTTLKREFDGWMDEAVDTALVSGDPSALSTLKEARALRAEFGRRFEGGKDTDKFIAGLLDGSRTPEELVNVALGASQVSKSGGARFIERLRQASQNDPEVIGSLRAAHFSRLTRGQNGEPLDMGKIVRNVRQTEYSNASVVKALYSPEEWSQVKQLASALDPLVAKGDFAKSSGTSERLARMMFAKMGGGLPVVGGVMEGFNNVRNAVQAGRAVNAPLRPRAESPLWFLPTVPAATDEFSR